MKLEKILQGLNDLKLRGDLNTEISGIEKNSKNVKPGFLFVAIKGFTVDGHKYIESAIENGATAVMVQEGCDLKSLKITWALEVKVRTTLATTNCQRR